MSRTGWLLLGLLAAGLLVWLLWTLGADDPPPDPNQGIGVDDSEEGAPGLSTRTDGARPAGDADARLKRCALHGTVTRGGVPASARVELHLLTVGEDVRPSGDRRHAAIYQVHRIGTRDIPKGKAAATTRSDAHGRYAFGGVKSGEYTLRAAATGAAWVQRMVDLRVPGRVRVVDLDLAGGRHRLTGRALHADGRPFVGFIFVHRQETEDEDAVSHVVRVGPDGSFEVGGLNGGRWSVAANTPGSFDYEVDHVSIPRKEPLLLVVDADAREIRGRVLTKRRTPVPGASVLTLMGGGVRIAAAETLSGPDGKFALRIPGGLSSGFVQVLADGYLPYWLSLSSVSEAPLTLVLRATGKVTGRLVTVDGAVPPAGVPVYASPSTASRSIGAVVGTYSGADGRFVLDGVPPDHVRIWALGSGWVSVHGGDPASERPASHAVFVEPGEPQELAITVASAATLRGRVLDHTGTPLAGAAVKSVATDLPGGHLLASWGTSGAYASVSTDAEGRFEATLPRAGVTWQHHVFAAGHAEFRTRALPVAAEGADDLEIRLPPPCMLDVLVRTKAGGAPIAGARLSLMTGFDAKEDSSHNWILAHTGEDGSARLGPTVARAGELNCEAPGLVTVERTHTPGPSAGVLVIEMETGARIEGRVILPEGAAPEEAAVYINAINDRVGFDMPEVAADGTFASDSLKPGSYLVEADIDWMGWNYEVDQIVKTGGSPVVLDLAALVPKDGIVRLRFVEGSGRPVLGGGGVVQSLTKGPDGAWDSGWEADLDLRGGVARVPAAESEGSWYAEVHGFADPDLGAVIHGPLDPRVPDVDVVVTEARHVRGVVRAAGGDPLPGVRVSATVIHPMAPATTMSEHAFATTDRLGRFDIGGLGPYAYMLAATPPAAYRRPAPVRAESGAGDVEITLEEGGYVDVKVLDAAGRPVPGATVGLGARGLVARLLKSLTEGRSPDRVVGMLSRGFKETRTDARGVARLSHLEDGKRHTLLVRSARAPDALVQRIFPEWTPASLEVRLEKARTLKGRVEDQHGAPFADCVVFGVSMTDLAFGTADVDLDGSFVLPGLPQGTVNLYAIPRYSVAGWDFTKAKPLVVGSGQGLATLTVDVGETLAFRLVADGVQFDDVALRVTPEPLERAEYWPNLDDSGRVVLRGLPPGKTYTVGILGLPGGRYVHRRGIVPGTEEIILEAKQGERLPVRLDLPPGVRPGSVYLTLTGAGCYAWEDLETKTEFVFEGLPPIELRLDAECRNEDASYEASVRVRPGEPVVLRLEKVD